MPSACWSVSSWASQTACWSPTSGLPSLITTIAVGGIGIALAGAINQGSSLPIPKAENLDVLIFTSFGPIPLLALLCAGAFLVTWFVQERLTLGHYIYAIAENRAAVVEAGIPVSLIVMLLFVFSGVCASFGGFLLTIELSSGQPSIAASLFLDGLTAVLLGGTMLKLGKPNVLGTLVSVVLLAALVRGGALLGWPDSFFPDHEGSTASGWCGAGHLDQEGTRLGPVHTNTRHRRCVRSG